MKKNKLIPINYIHSRWLLQSKANRPEEDESDEEVSCSRFRVQDSHMRSLKHAVLNGSTKWRTGMDIAERVIEAMSSQGTRSFLEMAGALRKFAEYASQGITPTIGSPEVDEILFSDESDAVAADDILSSVSEVPPTPQTKAKIKQRSDKPTLQTKAKAKSRSDEPTLPTKITIKQGSDKLTPLSKAKAKPTLLPKTVVKPTLLTKTRHKPDPSDEGEDEHDEEFVDLIQSDSARLIAETDAIVRRSREMVSSESEGEVPSNSHTLAKKTPKKSTTTRNLAVVAAGGGGVTVGTLNLKELVDLTLKIPAVADSKQLEEGVVKKDPSELVIPTNQLVTPPNQLVTKTKPSVKLQGQFAIRKRCTQHDDDDEESSSSEQDKRRFEIVKSTKNKGRPKIRKKQQREAKRIRMVDSVHQANSLVQGTLVPLKDLALVRKTLEFSFNVTDALPVMNSITSFGAPTWKSTTVVQIARKRKINRQVTIAFTNNYLTKCLGGIKTYRNALPSEHDAGKMGVTITKLGTYTEKDLITMKQWRDETPKLEAISDLACWVRLSKFSRISMPFPLNNCVNVDTKACAKRLEMVDLRDNISTRFGKIPVHEIASFRRTIWLDDSCIMLVMHYLMDQDGIGGVNPLYARLTDDDMKRNVIESTSPFQRGNKIVLVPVYLDSHWSGVVFNFDDSKLIFFDPMQIRSNYEAMEAIVNEYFGEHVSGLEKTRKMSPRQEDTSSCGPLTLLFFESTVLGIPVPNVLLESVGYLRFRFMFLASKGAFCCNADAAAEDSS